MNIKLNGKNVVITEDLERLVQKKMKKLEKFFRPNAEAQVRLASVKKREIAEVTIWVDGLVIRGEVASADLRTSLDRVVEKVEKQILHHKTRLANRVHDGSLAEWISDMASMEPGSGAEDEAESAVIREKRFSMKPLDIDEAILQLQMLGHDFFAFRNVETGMINVIYTRKDGGYGLLEPDIDGE